MKIDGLRCDKCNKEWYPDPMRVGALPEGWIALTKGSNGLVEQDKHFCSFKCLVNWASIQEFHETVFYRLDGETSSMLISYMKEKGWNAEFKVRKDLDGKSWEQFQAVKHNCVIHIDSSFFRGMTIEGMCKYIDKYISKYVGMEERKFDVEGPVDNPSHMMGGEFKVTKEDCDFWRDN